MTTVFLLHAAIGHNGGPALDDEFKWGSAPIDRYTAWKRAHDRAWRNIPYATMLRRYKNADALGLTYEEYTLELMFNGRHLTTQDADRIAEIKAARGTNADIYDK